MAGKVYLVGSGPGTLGLLSQRAASVIAGADTVLYDQLPGEEILASLPAGAERIDCGKFGGDHIKEQAEIERLMVEGARAGRTVVRLKGGDPFMFGRGGEETRGRAPGRHRGRGRSRDQLGPRGPGIGRDPAHPSALYLAGHGRDRPRGPREGGSAINWAGLAPGPGTIVVLMGVKNLPRIAEVLIAHGRDPATPVAVIERGLRRDQRVTVGRLDAIAALAAERRVRPPAVIVIGGVVEALRPGLARPDPARRHDKSSLVRATYLSLHMAGLKGGPTQDEVLAIALQKLALRPGDRVLDLGCGTGAVAVAAAATAAEVVAIDRRPEAIAHARHAADEAGAANVSFLEAEAGEALAGLGDVRRRLRGRFSRPRRPPPDPCRAGASTDCRKRGPDRDPAPGDRYDGFAREFIARRSTSRLHGRPRSRDRSTSDQSTPCT